MLLSAVSVLVVAQSSSEIPEGLMNNPVLNWEIWPIAWHILLISNNHAIHSSFAKAAKWTVNIWAMPKRDVCSCLQQPPKLNWRFPGLPWSFFPGVAKNGPTNYLLTLDYKMPHNYTFTTKLIDITKVSLISNNYMLESMIIFTAVLISP